jgi:hypothetical protein
MPFEPELLSIPQLLNHYTLILGELRKRGAIRTDNNPVGDYAEWLVTDRLGLELKNNSNSGYDAVDPNGVKYQIKSRRVTPRNPSTQLGAIRNLKNHDFDFLIAVIFNAQFEIQRVVKIPHKIIEQYAKYKEHVNAHILHLREDILSDPLTEDITQVFSQSLIPGKRME